jgi:glycosyltransferase involved in cell wall biosynthesis
MNAPDISVVMATANPSPSLYLCLDSLRNQERSAAAEIIISDASTDGSDEAIRTQYPDVRLLHFEGPLTAPQLLREGLRQACGRIIAVTDTYCRFPPDWLAKVCKAHEADYSVIGGAVENGNPSGILSWACFYADYVAFVLPAQREVTPLLAGNHVSYKKWVIERQLNSMNDGFLKVFFHWDLERLGMKFLLEPELVVHYTRRNTFGGFLHRYYRNAYQFAALRCKRLSSVSRFLRLMGSPTLPLILLYQRLRVGLRKKGHRARLLLSVPLLATFVAAWAAGEFMGYLCGPGSLSEGVTTANPI